MLALAALLVLGLKVGWAKLKSSNNFKIARIEVLGARRAGREEILYLSGLQLGMGIFDFRLANVVKEVESHPWVKKAQVSRELPDQVIIRVFEHTPAAIVLLGEPYYMNPELKVFKKLVPGDDLNYPIITGVSLESLEQANPEILAGIQNALSVWRLASSSKIFPARAISELHIDPLAGLSLITGQGPIVNFGEDGLEEKFKRLERIQVELGEQFGLLKRLDLSQADRAVARFYQKETDSLVQVENNEGAEAEAK